jgi:Leucine-rich repeat (LRR) protein
MKKLYLLLPILFLIYWGCEDKEEDTTPPTITITSPQDGSTVYEIVTITCMSSDNEGVEKVELWVDGVSTGVTDNTEPYSLDWNTTTFEDGSHTIIVRSYDTSVNTMDSDPITLTVDNSGSNPESVSINSIVFEDGSFTITWNQSIDGDFDSYELEKSVESTMDDYSIIYTTEGVTDTTYVDSDVDPLSYQYYRITVIDTFGYETKGQIVSTSLDPVPTSMNVTSVIYTLTEMTVEWEESEDGDFRDYKLLYSETENGDKDTLVTYTDISTTSHIITDFDPLQENWYWVLVRDTLGQSSIGNGMTNSIDSSPTQINISSVTYDLTEMVISWNQSNDNDFVSYELLYSETESGEQTSITTITDINTTSHTITDFDPTQERWYWIKVTDYWNLTTVSNGYMVIDSPPTTSELYPIVYENGSFFITWSQNNDDDFVSYKLYESLSEDMSNDTLIYETEDRTDTTFIKTVQNIRYYQIVVEDLWGYQSISNIEVGDYDVELWGQSYSVLNTTELDLSYSGLTGSIPPEIGSLTNLERLELYGNELTGSIPSEMWNLTNLKLLYLRNNQLTGSIPPEIGNLTNLITLRLGINQLTGSIPPEIGNLTNLTYLNLWKNQLTGNIPESIWDLVELVRLDLDVNQLTGSIPSEIGNLTKLTDLNLQSNQLTGSIPPEIGNLTNLNHLFLYFNQLTGSIPSEIGNLTNLTRLNLSGNQLTGSIPESICELTNLNWSPDFIDWYYSYLYNNQLCPPYPSCIEDYVGDQDTSNCP